MKGLSLNALGESEKAIGLGDAVRRGLAQQLSQQGACDVENGVRRQCGERLVSVLVDRMVSIVVLRCAPALIKLSEHILGGPPGTI